MRRYFFSTHHQTIIIIRLIGHTSSASESETQHLTDSNGDFLFIEFCDTGLANVDL